MQKGEYVALMLMMPRVLHKRIHAILHHLDVVQNVPISQNLYIVKGTRWYCWMVKSRAGSDTCGKCRRKWPTLGGDTTVSTNARNPRIDRVGIKFKCPRDIYDEVKGILYQLESEQNSKITMRSFFDAAMATYTASIEAQGNKDVCPGCLRWVRKPIKEVDSERVSD